MSRWERPATRMSGRHDPTPEQARRFQQRVIAADVAAQRPTDQRATIARVLGLLAAELHRRRAGLQCQHSALWQVMHCYGITETEDDVRRAAR